MFHHEKIPTGERVCLTAPISDKIITETLNLPPLEAQKYRQALTEDPTDFPGVTLLEEKPVSGRIHLTLRGPNRSLVRLAHQIVKYFC